jgi:hypothetical protein
MGASTSHTQPGFWAIGPLSGKPVYQAESTIKPLGTIKSVRSMPLSAGTRLGPYEILAAIGAGGMGEVYKAIDTRLSLTGPTHDMSQKTSLDTLRQTALPSGLSMPRGPAAPPIYR